MARSTPKALRLLSNYLTDVVLREVDDLFEDNNIKLGTPQHEPNDPSVRRERGLFVVRLPDLRPVRLRGEPSSSGFRLRVGLVTIESLERISLAGESMDAEPRV